MRKKIAGLLTLLTTLVVQISFAQQKTVSGTVTDQSGVPLPGVNIIVEGTTTGTQTDFDGNYTIQANEGQTLVFTYIGLKTEKRVVSASTTINLQMQEDAQALEEVVVTALGIKRDKKSLGFAQQTVEGEALTTAKDVDINNAIAGKVSGVQMLGAPSSGFDNAVVRLRGETDLLYVVDGVKVNSAADINTDDIADLSVLKGSAATALYGPIGKNGVVVITTKRGKEGKATFTLDQSVQISNVYLLPEYQNEYGGGYTQDFATLNGELIPNYAADESWGPRLDGRLVRHWDSWIPGSPTFGELRPWSPNPDNVKDFYETGITSNTFLGFTKGGEDYNIKANLRRVEISGVSPNSGRDLIQTGLSTEYNITDNFKVFANFNYQYRATLNNPDNGYGGIGSNFNQWFQRQLDMKRLKNNYFQNGNFYTWNMRSTTDLRPLYWDSPYFEVYQNLKHEYKNSTFGNIGFTVDITDELSFTNELRQAVNTFQFNDRTAFGGLNLPSYRERNQTISTTEYFGMLTYDKDINEDFDVKASIGTELYQFKNSYVDASTNSGLTIPGFYSIETSKERPTYTSRYFEQKNRGVFATASLGYKDLLYLDGSFRMDWNSTADPSSNRVDTKGGSLSFLFSNLFESEALSFGKLRLGYAEAPSFPSIHALNASYDVVGSYNGTTVLRPDYTQANPTLKGGTRKELEIGTELKFVNNRLGLDLTYFDRRDVDLPVAAPLSATTGYTAVNVNSAETKSNGFEVALYATPFKTEDFEWNTSLNFATLKREVVALYGDVETEVLASSWRGLRLEAHVGEEWGAFYGRKILRDDQGRMLINSSGEIQYEENQYLGNLLPDFTGGFVNTIRYKNFDLSFSVDFQKGGKFFSVTKMFNNYSGLGIETVGNNALGNPVRDMPVGSGGEATVVAANDAQSNSGGVLVEGVDATTGEPASYYVEAQEYWGRTFALHEMWLYDASYVKLRQLRLGYTLPDRFVSKLPVEDIKVSFFANNLWLIHSEVEGIDPSEIENTNGGSAVGQGYRWAEGGQLPSSRTLGMNIRLTF